MTVRTDLYTKIVLTAVAVLLGVLALQPLVNPVAARAETDAPSVFIEPGLTRIPDANGAETLGKLVIDLKTVRRGDSRW